MYLNYSVMNGSVLNIAAVKQKQLIRLLAHGV